MNIFSYIIYLVCLITAALTVYSLKYRKVEGSLVFSLVLFAATIYSFGYANELASTTVEEIKFWLHIEYIGISFIPALWIIFAFGFTGSSDRLQKWHILVLLGLSAINFIIVFTNDFHHLFHSSITINYSGPIPIAELSKGFWYWIHISYFNISVIISNYLFLRMLIKNPGSYRNQALIMLIGSLIPWISTMIYILGMSPYGLDSNPFTLALTGIVFSIGIFRYKVLDLVPIALEYVFESLQDGRILIDRDLRIVNYNNAATVVFNNLDHKSIGKKILNVFELPEDIKNQIQSNTESSILHELITNQGKKYYQISVSNIKNKKGILLGQIIMLFDQTEQKITQQKLINLNNMKDKFFSIIAHDLRNPLSAFKMSLEFLTSQYDDFTSEEIKEFLDAMKEGSKNLYELLENLLQWSRLQSGATEYIPEPVVVYKVVENNISFLKANAANKGIPIKNLVDKNAICYTDINMVSGIIRNLISNGIKFTKEGGSITVSNTYDNTNNFIVVCISDTGIGMSKELIEKLFRIDVKITSQGTANEKGTGLGLIICKEFAEMNGGKIWVESQPGLGSKFYFSLPVKKINSN